MYLTFVLTNSAERDRWVPGALARQFTMLKDADVLEETLRGAVVEGGGDVVRVVVDGGTTLERFMQIVAAAPETFTGEILFVSGDGSGYVSRREIEGVRTLRAATSSEVEVYLRWHGLPARPRSSYAPERPPSGLPAPERTSDRRPS